MQNIQIKNGRVIDPKNKVDQVTDVFISQGKILALGETPSSFQADTVVDATDLIVCPGLVDLSARLREPGDEYKATLISELQAAVAGGITSLACPPDTDPVLDEPGLVEMLKHRTKQLNLANVYPLGALTRQLAGKTLSEMNELTAAGCVGFSQANISITNTQVLWRAMQYAATFNFTLFLNAEEPFLAQGGVAHDGEVATRLGLKGIPSAAEALALASILRIAKETNAHVHITRLSSAEAVDMIRTAKKQGLNVTCDVAITHLHLTEHDIGFYNSHCHLKPPLRTQRDKDALSTGLKDGTIDAICSDHSPVDDDAKLVPFAQSEIGASGLELLLPLTLKWANQAKVSMSDALNLISHQASSILNIKAGSLTIGHDADLCLFDAKTFWRVEAKSLKSQGKNTPFDGFEIAGKVKTTIRNGRIVYQQ
jgi:dihydroorotase